MKFDDKWEKGFTRESKIVKVLATSKMIQTAALVFFDEAREVYPLQLKLKIAPIAVGISFDLKPYSGPRWTQLKLKKINVPKCISVEAKRKPLIPAGEQVYSYDRSSYFSYAGVAERILEDTKAETPPPATSLPPYPSAPTPPQPRAAPPAPVPTQQRRDRSLHIVGTTICIPKGIKLEDLFADPTEYLSPEASAVLQDLAMNPQKYNFVEIDEYQEAQLNQAYDTSISQ